MRRQTTQKLNNRDEKPDSKKESVRLSPKTIMVTQKIYGNKKIIKNLEAKPAKFRIYY